MLLIFLAGMCKARKVQIPREIKSPMEWASSTIMHEIARESNMFIRVRQPIMQEILEIENLIEQPLLALEVNDRYLHSACFPSPTYLSSQN